MLHSATDLTNARSNFTASDRDGFLDYIYAANCEALHLWDTPLTERRSDRRDMFTASISVSSRFGFNGTEPWRCG